MSVVGPQADLGRALLVSAKSPEAVEHRRLPGIHRRPGAKGQLWRPPSASGASAIVSPVHNTFIAAHRARRLPQLGVSGVLLYPQWSNGTVAGRN